MRVLLTAGASGIGWHIATAFAGISARVELCDIIQAPAAAGIKSSICNVADAAALNGWMDGAIARLGGVDVLINNAGIAGPVGLVENVDDAEWRKCLDINLTAQFLTAKRAAPLMKAQKSGSIINISSVSGQFGVGLRSAYVAAKWAVVGFTKSLAIELGPHNVRANAICPGSVSGDRMDRVVTAEAASRGVTPEQVRAEYTSGQSIRRFVEPSEVADLCLFLASPAAKMISGQAIAVDGHTETFHMG